MQTRTDDSGLGWEKSDGAAEAVGICLSGGGIRAAMFSLGVLQRLQEERGLLFGPSAAQWLSAVSGGSYTASAYIGNAAQLSQSSTGPIAEIEAPLAVGSPEEDHLFRNNLYLATPWLSQPFKALAGILIGPATLLAMLIWVGAAAALVGALVLWMSSTPGAPSWAEGQPLWLTAPLAALPLILLGRSLFAESTTRAFAYVVLGQLGAIVFFPLALESLYAIESLRTLGGWLLPALGCAALVLATGVSTFVSKFLKPAGAVLNRLERSSVLLLVLVLIAGAATIALPTIVRILMEIHTSADAVWFVSVLVAPFVAASILRRTSLHQMYRQSLNKAFGAVRTSSNHAAIPLRPLLLSQCRSENGTYPRLLVSATANVRHQHTDGTFRTFTSFVFSHERCGIPSSEMWFATEKLELAQGDAYLSMSTEPLVTLPTSVAATGAAISASMGRYTRPSRRLLLALANIRIGRTLPNAARPDRRVQVAALTSPQRVRTRVSFLAGVDDLLAELLGINGPNMYVSDGGHYDNLGLMALLRARCKTIWCVDAEPDPLGAAAELRRVAGLAKDELGVSLSWNLGAFSTTTRGVFPTTHLHGSIDYGGGVRGTIHVVKLGLHASSPQGLLQYQALRPAYPHHSTFNQFFSRRRMTAYRDIGRDNAARLLKDVHAIPEQIDGPCQTPALSCQ